MFNGPRTRKCFPMWSIAWILPVSAKMPDAGSLMTASSSQLSHSRVMTSRYSLARS
jgi:hypothetical protein